MILPKETNKTKNFEEYFADKIDDLLFFKDLLRITNKCKTNYQGHSDRSAFGVSNEILIAKK